MISHTTVSAMKNMIVKYPLHVISFNTFYKKAQKQIGNLECETD